MGTKSMASVVLAWLAVAMSTAAANAASPDLAVGRVRDPDSRSGVPPEVATAALQQPWDMPAGDYNPNAKSFSQFFTERSAGFLGSIVGSTLGGGAGLVVLGPAGMVLGGAIGAFVGEVVFEWAASNRFNRKRGPYLPQMNPPLVPAR